MDGAQPRANLFGVGVVEFPEDGQRTLPRGASGRAIAGGVMDVAEAGQRFGLVVAVAGLPAQVDGVLVAIDGLAVLAEPLVCVAEAVQVAAWPARPPVSSWRASACPQ